MPGALSEPPALPISPIEGTPLENMRLSPLNVRRLITLRRLFRAIVVAAVTLGLVGVTIATAGRPEAVQRAPRQLSLVESHKQTARPHPRREGKQGPAGPIGPR